MVIKKISNKELRDFSGEHLYYEIKMLYEITDILKGKFDNVYVYNGLIESFVIHTYILLDFFYKPRIKADDAKAMDYIKDVKTWKQKRLPFDKYFRNFNRRRSREVVHLSYKRLDRKKEDKVWYSNKTTDHIKKLVSLFLKEADPELIDPKLEEFK